MKFTHTPYIVEIDGYYYSVNVKDRELYAEDNTVIGRIDKDGKVSIDTELLEIHSNCSTVFWSSKYSKVKL